MSLFIPLVVLIGMALAAVIYLLGRRKRGAYGMAAWSDTSDAPVAFPPDAFTVRGGAAVESKRASYPFAVLTADRDQLQIKISAPFFPAALALGRSDVTRLDVRRSVLGVALLFQEPAGAADAVTFWALSKGPMTRGLRSLGWLDLLPAPDDEASDPPTPE